MDGDSGNVIGFAAGVFRAERNRIDAITRRHESFGLAPDPDIYFIRVLHYETNSIHLEAIYFRSTLRGSRRNFRSATLWYDRDAFVSRPVILFGICEFNRPG